MAKKQITVPGMGESITEATIGEILKASGSSVKMDEELVELETDKVNQVLYASASGQIKWSVKKGDVVTIGQEIGYIEEGAEEAKAAPAKEKAAPEKTKSKEKTETKTAPEKEKAPVEEKEEKIIRKQKSDFIEEMRLLKDKPQTIAKEVQEETKIDTGEHRVPMSRLRQTIAQRLVEAQHNTAMLTTFNEVDMSHIVYLRTACKEEFEKKHGVRLGLMSFFVKACVAALQAVPGLNASIDGHDIVYREHMDIGIAVGTERGVIVPVIRCAESLSYAEIERAIIEFSRKAKEAKLSLEELQGGSFTITNGGVYGSLLSTPILNPPQSGILGVHKIEKRPVVIEDAIVIRPMMYVALSYDHRIVDGREAVQFLVKVKEFLEEPARELLDI